MTRLTFRTFATAAIVVAVMASGVVPAVGRQRPAAPVFTTQQATAGRVAYARSCASCHMPDLSGNIEIPPLAGTAFKDTWGARSTKDLLDYMSAAMPYGGPSLTAETYISITAYVLQSNGAVAGERELTASTVAPIGGLTAARVTPPALTAPPGPAETATGAAPVGSGSEGGVPAP